MILSASSTLLCLRLCIFLLTLNKLECHGDDYRLLPSDEHETFSVNTSVFTTKFGVKAYLAIITGGARGFRIVVDNARCPVHKTSTFAKRASCSYAVNGGPFQSYTKGGCVGDIIVNGTQLVGKGGDYATFGVTAKQEWFIGHIQQKNMAEDLGVRDLITGLGDWLLRDGIITPESGGITAPRTSIGITKKGTLVILQVDGCEHCLDSRKRGLTLSELAELLASDRIKAEHAINLDGGGSSTSVLNGKTINHPTCLDYIPIKCERLVASIICIREVSLPVLPLSESV